MKKTAIILFVLATAFTAMGQDITGQWNGVLKVPGAQLRLIVHINKTDNGFSSTMDSPDQGAKGIPVSKTTFENGTLKLEITNLGAEYTGLYKENLFSGTFKQAGQQFPMDLSRKEAEKQIVKRPQEPAKPYPYYSEDVVFPNPSANITLAGTLTLPSKEGNYPVVVLITGSGPQNRDEELMGHKPFLIIADYLTKNGIAVLRYDDRGTAKSTGDFKKATSQDFATDVEAAIAFLKTRKEINQQKIGLMGHSEGGLIAPMVAASTKGIGFIVLLAGPGLRGDKLLLLQEAAIAKASGETPKQIAEQQAINAGAFDIVVKATDTLRMKTGVESYLLQATKDTPAGIKKKDYVKTLVDQITTPWMRYFIQYDPALALAKVKCPVLAVDGEKDLQVLPKENIAAINKALAKGGNKTVTTKIFPGLNHLFQECTTGLVGEYGTIEQTFSPVVLEYVTKWIKEKTK
ncbi:alpha/beta hydrolase family protein [Parasediminibacterium sp. JCM 36343]|uniref:alpha/beta hydrolase family protein n=1 Tax=Parasediminibacterium sp. JCM 36343 TaxID=3374279 RepID=UPI0039791B2A